MCKDGERHGESKLSCPSTQHNVPSQGSNAGVECSNHEATAELKAKKGRRPLKASLSRAEKMELGSKSWPSEHSVGQVLVKYRPRGGRVAMKYQPGVGQHACQFMSTDTRLSLGWVSVNISTECRLPYRPIVSTDPRSTDALSTHDPHFPAAEEKQNSFCQYIVTNRVTLWSTSYSAWYTLKQLLFTSVSMKVVDIYLPALQPSKYPPLFTSASVNNC